MSAFRYTIILHARMRAVTVYQGDSLPAMAAAQCAVEHTLATTRQSAEIEILENGESRWTEYDKGKRAGFRYEGAA